MCFFISLIPGTVLASLGFFVLFGASKAKGGLKTFGRILGLWVFLVALIPPIAGLYLTGTGLCPAERMLTHMGERMP